MFTGIKDGADQVDATIQNLKQWYSVLVSEIKLLSIHWYFQMLDSYTFEWTKGTSTTTWNCLLKVWQPFVKWCSVCVCVQDHVGSNPPNPCSVLQLSLSLETDNVCASYDIRWYAILAEITFLYYANNEEYTLSAKLLPRSVQCFHTMK